MSDTPDFSQGPSLRSIAMPADTNANGDMFGGWLLAQMDLAGAACAKIEAKGRVVTIGIEAMKFHMPVHVGDEVSCFTHIVKIGRTSITVQIDAWVRVYETGETQKVTEGVFTYVAIDRNRKPRPIKGD